ncbi:HAD family hydrolase [Chitinophaga sp. Cy-1792]|uniref:HAD family hydrolase n=1 Tax=Chitinophaga sp. Cy-1792 TaxID=2608339 RepID=UPI001423B85C|nr:HAD family hydrolase [Chitinophaga sp. Cy-1792]NIG56559.1 HAD family hydrolase [Chitinophaga sp. Cy-1792]
MNKFRHYSFDLWLTLIKSNPLFKSERVQYIHRHFNSHQLTVAEVAAIFRRVDVMSNAINERTGKNLDTDELYLMVISEVNGERLSLRDIDLEQLYTDMEELFLHHLPLLYCGKTAVTLERLRSQPDTTVGLLSNTAFIKGATLRKALEQLEILHLLDIQLFSDEAGISKPNAKFFEQMVAAVTTHRQEPVAPEHIVHIGDNPIADIRGAEAYGIPAMLINSNKVCISTVI